MKSLEKKQFYTILMFFLIAITLKSAALYETSKLDYCNLYIQPHDSFFNIRSAQEFINPDINVTINDFVPDTAYKPLLKTVFFFFGVNLTIIRALQIFISSLMVLLLFLIGKSMQIKYLGIILMFLWVFATEITLFDLQILKYSLNFSCTLITIYMIYRYNKNHSLLNLTLCLISILILSSFRPIYYFLLIYLLKLSLNNIKGRYLKKYLNLTLLIFLPLSIIGWINFASDKSKTHVGIHMYKGFNVLSTGFYENTPYVRDNSFGHMKEALVLGKKLSSKFNRYQFIGNFWLQKSIAFICDNPFAALRLIFIKSTNLLFYQNFDDTIDILNLKNKNFSLKITFIKFNYLIPLALIGFFSFLISKKKYFMFHIVNVFFLLQFASVLATCLTTRYQAQLLPVIIIYSGIGLCYILDNINKKHLYLLLPVFIVFYFLSYKINFKKINLKIPGRTAYHKIRLEDYKEAKTLFEPWSKHKQAITFNDLKIIQKKFLNALATIDSERSIKMWLDKKNVSLKEKTWCLEALGDTCLLAKQYREALTNYEKATQIEETEQLLKKIKTAKNYIFLSSNPTSYR